MKIVSERIGACVLLGLLTGCGSTDGGLASDSGGTSEERSQVCAANEDCDDANACNGSESCSPESDEADASGCLPGRTVECAADEVCRGNEGKCVRPACDLDGDGHESVSCGGDDCDDEDANRYPGNLEVCVDESGDPSPESALRDEDCDDSTLSEDGDGDGYYRLDCANQQADGELLYGDDCDDNNDLKRPGFAEICDGLDNDCENGLDYPGEDDDGDGFPDCEDLKSMSNFDCDDADPTSYPGADETCNGADNNCDGQIDDADGDGHVAIGDTCSGGFPKDDCNDLDSEMFPGAEEVADGKDNDCDETLGTVEDLDGDGFSTFGHLAPKDCDDNDDTVYPGAPELCDGIDSNCDHAVEDWDGDDHIKEGTACSGGPMLADDCDDLYAHIHPGALELCDGTDTDCDGKLNGPGEDEDDDGYTSCVPYWESDWDCDDNDAEFHPNAPEYCGGPDLNCDGLLPGEDNDHDGFVVEGSCVEITPVLYDCDDSKGPIYPGAPETCSTLGIDNDCDTDADEFTDSPLGTVDDCSVCGDSCADGFVCVTAACVEVYDEFYSISYGNYIKEEAAPGWTEGDHTHRNSNLFGAIRDFDGERFIVGVQNADYVYGSARGAAYIYARDPQSADWFLEGRLTSPWPGPFTNFGGSVAIDGNIAVVGARGSSSASRVINQGGGDTSGLNNGAAMVYEFNGSSWEFAAFLVAPNSDRADLFGWRVSVSGDTVAVHARDEDGGNPLDMDDNSWSNAGAIYTFVRALDGTYSFEQYIKPSELEKISYGPYLHGDRMLFGSYEAANGCGVIYALKRNTGVWTQTDELLGEFSENCIDGGLTFALSATDGNRIVASYFDPFSLGGAGVDYQLIFTRNGDDWGDPEQFYPFSPGYPSSISGDWLVYSDSANTQGGSGVNPILTDAGAIATGLVQVYRHSETHGWLPPAYIKPPHEPSFYGHSLAFGSSTVANGQLLINAAYDRSDSQGIDADETPDPNMTSVGAMHTYDLTAVGAP